MSELNVNAITDASGGNTASINGATPTTDNTMGKNRLINGDMRIDARNSGASVTPNNTYTLDRWLYENTQTSKVTIQQNAGSVTPPAGFTDYLGVTSTSAYSVLTGDTFLITQRIEGYNVADLAWGTANAQTITLSFWARSSLTGTFGGSLGNVNASRSYPFSYTIASANTWEYKTVTVAGDTSGTWNTGNGRGLSITFGLGSGSTYSGTAGAWASANLVQPTGSVSVVGTNGATFYITGVQLEAGSVATSFERVDYSEMLRRCQRYCYVGNSSDILSAIAPGTTEIWGNFKLSTIMRSVPSVSVSGSIRLSDNYFADYTSSSVTVLSNQLSTNGGRINLSNFSGLTVGRFYAGYDNGIGGKFTFSAEL